MEAFQRDHPDIDIRISATDRMVDLDDPELDLVLRYCDPPDAPPGAQRLFGEVLTPVVSAAAGRAQSATARRRRWPQPADLAEHTLLEEDDTPPSSEFLSWRHWLARATARRALQPRALALPELHLPAGAGGAGRPGRRAGAGGADHRAARARRTGRAVRPGRAACTARSRTGWSPSDPVPRPPEVQAVLRLDRVARSRRDARGDRRSGRSTKRRRKRIDQPTTPLLGDDQHQRLIVRLRRAARLSSISQSPTRRRRRPTTCGYAASQRSK